jgi:nucleoside-diphosphate-sugar epimerase
LPDRPNEPRVSFASVARLRDEVGFVPSIALEDGLREALEYWRGASLTQQV